MAHVHTELPFQQSLWNVIIKKQSLWNVCAVMVNVCADLAMVHTQFTEVGEQTVKHVLSYGDHQVLV